MYSFFYFLPLLLISEMAGRRGRTRGPARGRGEPDRGRGRPRRQARGPIEDVQDLAQIPEGVVAPPVGLTPEMLVAMGRMIQEAMQAKDQPRAEIGVESRVEVDADADRVSREAVARAVKAD